MADAQSRITCILGDMAGNLAKGTHSHTGKGSIAHKGIDRNLSTLHYEDWVPGKFKQVCNLFNGDNFFSMRRHLAGTKPTDRRNVHLELHDTNNEYFLGALNQLAEHMLRDAKPNFSLGLGDKMAAFIAVGMMVQGLLSPTEAVLLPMPMSACICTTAAAVIAKETPPECHVCCKIIHQLHKKLPLVLFSHKGPWTAATCCTSFEKAYNTVVNFMCTRADVLFLRCTEGNMATFQQALTMAPEDLKKDLERGVDSSDDSSDEDDDRLKPAWITTAEKTGPDADKILEEMLQDDTSNIVTTSVTHDPSPASRPPTPPQPFYKVAIEKAKMAESAASKSAAAPAAAAPAPPPPPPPSHATAEDSSTPRRGTKRKSDENGKEGRKGPKAKRTATVLETTFKNYSEVTEMSMTRSVDGAEWEVSVTGAVSVLNKESKPAEKIMELLAKGSEIINWRRSKNTPGSFVIESRLFGHKTSCTVPVTDAVNPDEYTFTPDSGDCSPDENGTLVYSARGRLSFGYGTPFEFIAHVFAIFAKMPGCTRIGCSNITDEGILTDVWFVPSEEDKLGVLNFIFPST